jgi:hypothetical protein
VLDALVLIADLGQLSGRENTFRELSLGYHTITALMAAYARHVMSCRGSSRRPQSKVRSHGSLDLASTSSLVDSSHLFSVFHGRVDSVPGLVEQPKV